MPWDDSDNQNEQPARPPTPPVTVGAIRRASAQVPPSLDPLVYDQDGNRLSVRKVDVSVVSGRPRLVLYVQLEQPAFTTTDLATTCSQPQQETTHAAS